jgi:hypothetical protein
MSDLTPAGLLDDLQRQLVGAHLDTLVHEAELRKTSGIELVEVKRLEYRTGEQKGSARR